MTRSYGFGIIGPFLHDTEMFSVTVSGYWAGDITSYSYGAMTQGR